MSLKIKLLNKLEKEILFIIWMSIIMIKIIKQKYVLQMQYIIMSLCQQEVIPLQNHGKLNSLVKTKNENGTCIIYKKDIEKKLYVDIGFSGDTIFHYVATDRELLNDFQEEIIDKDIKELEKEMEKILAKYESEKAKIQEKIDTLLNKKLEKYED